MLLLSNQISENASPGRPTLPTQSKVNPSRLSSFNPFVDQTRNTHHAEQTLDFAYGKGGDGRPNPTRPDNNLALARTLATVGFGLMARGEPAAATAMVAEGLELLEANVGTCSSTAVEATARKIQRRRTG